MNRQMAAVEAQLEEALIKQHCGQLRLPSVAAQFSRIAEACRQRTADAHPVFESAAELGSGRP